mgnify:CR=1 FL=1
MDNRELERALLLALDQIKSIESKFLQIEIKMEELTKEVNNISRDLRLMAINESYKR